MIRIVKTGYKLLGLDIDNIEEDAEGITNFAEEGMPVILVNDLEDLWNIDIDPDDVKMVE